jgi:hypothetical protein
MKMKSILDCLLPLHLALRSSLADAVLVLGPFVFSARCAGINKRNATSISDLVMNRS